MSKFDLFNGKLITLKPLNAISYELVHMLYEEEFTRIEMLDIRVSDVVINEQAHEHVMRLPEFSKSASPRARKHGIIGKLSGATVWLCNIERLNSHRAFLKAYPSHSIPNLISTLDVDFPEIWTSKHELGI